MLSGTKEGLSAAGRRDATERPVPSSAAGRRDTTEEELPPSTAVVNRDTPAEEDSSGFSSKVSNASMTAFFRLDTLLEAGGTLS